MDIKVAAKLTKKFIDEYTFDYQSDWPDDEESLSYEHISSMLEDIVSGEVSGEKAHRWLGWAQCAAVGVGVGTLEDMKHINYEA